MGTEPILKSHRRPEDVDTTVVAVGNVRFGDGSFPVIAGPLAVESEDQIIEAARLVAEGGGSLLRAAAFRAENSPYTFRGLGEEGLWLLEKAGFESGLPTVTEVNDVAHIELIADHVDMLEIAPDNMQNFTLLQVAGRARKPVLLHRGPSATIDEWLLAAEYVLAEDNPDVVLCERGSRGFDPRTSDTLDISAIPVVQRMSHLPVIIDPAPARGAPDVLTPLALAGRSAGADGLVVAVHPRPDEARAGNGAQLDGTGYLALMDALGIPMLRDEIDRIDRELIKLVALRMRRSVEIAIIKAKQDIRLRSPNREAELIAEARDDASALGLDPDYAQQLMELVLTHSRAAQHRALESDGSD